MTKHKIIGLGGHFIYSVDQRGSRIGRHKTVEQNTSFASFNIVGSGLEVIKVAMHRREIVSPFMKYIVSEIMPSGTFDAPHEMSYRRSFQALFFRITLNFCNKPNSVIRQILVVV